jgi:hypothetical protein
MQCGEGWQRSMRRCYTAANSKSMQLVDPLAIASDVDSRFYTGFFCSFFLSKNVGAVFLEAKKAIKMKIQGNLH